MAETATARPLAGFRVLELGHLIAGPFTGSVLGYFGAEVIKVEAPGQGDPIRHWREMKDGSSLWWHSVGRNKKSVSIDLKTERGRELVRDLAGKSDVLIENFRPGVMEKWNLGPEDLKSENPDLIYTRISGYGQTGPYSQKPGFASVCEAFSGFRYVNGFPGEAPVRQNLSIGDTVAALHAVLGILLALLNRKAQGGSGQVVDVAIYESMFNLLEAVVPEYSGNGVVRQPSGTTITGIVPTNTYACADGRYLVIGGNGDGIFKRLMRCVGREDMADDPALAHNPGRVEHEAKIDAVLGQWCAGLPLAEAQAQLESARVPCGPIYSAADMFTDPHYRARGLLEEHEVNGETLAIPAILPKLSGTPGGTDWTGPPVGSHTDEVLEQLLGLDADARRQLAEESVI